MKIIRIFNAVAGVVLGMMLLASCEAEEPVVPADDTVPVRAKASMRFEGGAPSYESDRKSVV